ncbi:DEAD/DEAH box helicase [Ornithinicoccus hortensis]|uniref:DEAD/DEAH box helicase domain-containing protein n=1 Tax=Ornithinicoccus hortensis TaxID=82346 RepID=A0A542YW18_9MICO|nr:DEAD/DEAH box helicase [Ornithinicoccus hortensis]TQL52271.1 DEAD/DEAH box helicase domain-containing protein [Ornithinicoccus hortensis]
MTDTPTRTGRFDPASMLAQLSRGDERLIHVHRVSAREAVTAPWPDWVDPTVYAAWSGRGITHLWRHQAEVAALAREGRHAVCATGTASGKSLGYLLPVLSALAEGTAAPTGRGATALYLAPTKALAGDQLSGLESLALPGVRCATYDGDTAPEERRWIRDHAHYVLTNPDLVHHSLLPGHPQWAPFLRALRFVVVDECHVYRGVFGAHVSAVLRRLLRVAARYRARPTVLLASATVADPAGHASRLVGQDVVAVTEDASPREATTFGLWEPPLTTEGTRRSAVAETADLLADLVVRDVQTVAFARSRVGVEVVAQAARRGLEPVDAGLARRVAAYRGGYLPEERRELEEQLRSRTLLGLAATTALELGIDIEGLDAALLAGWPGTRASFWQQAGRAGRSGAESLAVLVAGDDPLDTYLVHHPEAIFRAPVESSVIDPANPQVLAPHLAAAAAELPLTEEDTAWFGPSVPELAEALVAGGVLRRRPKGWYWARPDRAADHVRLRGIGQQVRIVDSGTGGVLGTVDEPRAPSVVHTGAVYVHQGQPYVVTGLDLSDGSALVVPGDPGWSTQARSVSEFVVTGVREEVAWGPVRLHLGSVRVTSQVTSFLRRLPSGEVIGEHPLDLPPSSLDTSAVWWTIPEAELARAGVEEGDVPGALHAAEHASIGLLPLIATCDRWDIGGVSTALHPDTGLPTVMVYDGYPGGAGFAERGFHRAAEWLTATLQAIDSCGCATGCPSCVQSPKCGNGNNPLDKAGAAAVLRHVLLGTPPDATGP